MPATADCRRVAECSACRADLSGDNLATRIKHIFACRRAHDMQQAVAAVPAAVTTAAAAAPGVSDEPPATEVTAEVTAEVAAKAAAAEAEAAAAAERAAPCQLPALPMQPPTPMPPPMRTPGQTPSAARTVLPQPSVATVASASVAPSAVRAPQPSAADGATPAADALSLLMRSAHTKWGGKQDTRAAPAAPVSRDAFEHLMHAAKTPAKPLKGILTLT